MTFLDDLPDDVRAAYKIVGNQNTGSLRNMVVALRLHPFENTDNDWRRLDAAELILRERARR